MPYWNHSKNLCFYNILTSLFRKKQASEKDNYPSKTLTKRFDTCSFSKCSFSKFSFSKFSFSKFSFSKSSFSKFSFSKFSFSTFSFSKFNNYIINAVMPINYIYILHWSRCLFNILFGTDAVYWLGLTLCTNGILCFFFNILFWH